MARLPIIIDSDGKERQTLMRQLEYGTHENNGEKKGGIAWEGYDGLIVPVPAGEPRSRRQVSGIHQSATITARAGES